MMNNLTPAEYTDYSNKQHTAKKAAYDVLLFELIHDDPIAWIAFQNAVSYMSAKQRSHLRVVLD